MPAPQPCYGTLLATLLSTTEPHLPHGSLPLLRQLLLAGFYHTPLILVPRTRPPACIPTRSRLSCSESHVPLHPPPADGHTTHMVLIWYSYGTHMATSQLHSHAPYTAAYRHNHTAPATVKSRHTRVLAHCSPDMRPAYDCEQLMVAHTATTSSLTDQCPPAPATCRHAHQPIYQRARF